MTSLTNSVEAVSVRTRARRRQFRLATLTPYLFLTPALLVYIGFLIYRGGPTAAMLWACAGATIAINAATTRLVVFSALCGSIVAVLALAVL